MKHAFQRISQSLIEMALITGALIRVLHVVFSTHGDSLDWHAFLGEFVLLPILLLALATVHLANYPVKEWLWRAPVFAIAEAVVEAFFSLALIHLQHERWGTSRATMADWPTLAGQILILRFLVVCIFAFVLGVVVQFVRKREFAADRRHQHLQQYLHEHAGEPHRGEPPPMKDRRRPPPSP